MTDPSEFITFTEDDGSFSLLDREQAQHEVSHLVALMIVMKPETSAAKELMRLNAESGSTAYTRWLAEEASKLLVLYLLERSPTFSLGFSLDHLSGLIYSYRSIRPVPPVTESPE